MVQDNRINTGVVCPLCSASDCRKFENGGFFPAITYVCPKCAKVFRIEESSLPSALKYQLSD